jgi:hypothetical protein
MSDVAELEKAWQSAFHPEAVVVALLVLVSEEELRLR